MNYFDKISCHKLNILTSFKCPCHIRKLHTKHAKLDDSSEAHEEYLEQLEIGLQGQINQKYNECTKNK